MFDVLLIVLAVSVAVVTALFLRERQRRQELTFDYEQAAGKHRSSEKFLNRVFAEMRGGGVSGAMQIAVRHVAESCAPGSHHSILLVFGNSYWTVLKKET